MYLCLLFLHLLLLSDISSVRMIRSRFLSRIHDLPRILGESLHVQNKKIITLSPGGFRGFYIFGLCKFLKEKYDIQDYVFSGASAGAWNSLFLCLKKNDNDFVENIYNINFQNVTDLNTIENMVKDAILEKYTSDDFDLHKLYIGTTVFKRFRFQTVIYTDFDDLEDALNCCIASSHIPFVTGKLFYKYRGLYSFDGGFSKYPYLNGAYANIHITPGIWEDKKKNTFNITDYTSLFSKKKVDFNVLFKQGYEDAHKNKERLDKLFL